MPQEADEYATTRSRSARWPEDLATVRRFFQEYRDWLAEHRDPKPDSARRVAEGLALVDRIIESLPGDYGRPDGDIVLWYDDEGHAACGALRHLEPKVGEIKRIFIRPDHRGEGFGMRYVRELVERARGLGYDRLRADTLGSMTSAIDFFQASGFTPIPAYWAHPAGGARFFERNLRVAPGLTEI